MNPYLDTTPIDDELPSCIRPKALSAAQAAAYQRAREQQQAKAMLRSLRARPTVDDVLDVVTSQTGVTRSQLTQRTRGKKGVAAARMAAVWLLRREGLSYLEIGRALGGRDHSTILHSHRKSEALRRADAELADMLDGMLSRVRERATG